MDRLSAAAGLSLLLTLTLSAAGANAATTLTATPSSIVPGGTVTAAWSGIPAPSVQDWIGLYTPAAGDANYLSWQYTNQSGASGSVPFSVSSGIAPGTYQLRLFSNNTYAKLATSNTFTVSVKIYGITRTTSGGTLSGVTLTATNGGTCTNSNASGQYTCTVPPGWSGSITPSVAGYIFTTPPSRSYTDLTTHQADQHYYAAVAIPVGGVVTVGGAPLAGVALAATNNGSCPSSTNAAGQYVCNVPEPWTGSITPSLSGYTFAPPSRNYTNLKWGAGEQNYAATATGSTGTVFYIHTDHLNSPRLITNGAGQARWRWDQSDPFGGNVPNENPSGLGAFTCNLRLPGQYFDKETNLHYNYFRDYDPGIGRYVQSDPIGLDGGMNTYAYVRNSPVLSRDPFGLVEWSGTITQISADYGGGATRLTLSLVSQCVKGRRARVDVLAGGFSVGFGASFGATRGGITFDDGLSAIDPFVFQGQSLFVGAGFTAGNPEAPPRPYSKKGWSFSCQAIRLGAATSIGCGSAMGFELSIAGGAGISTVRNVSFECCE